MTTGREPIDLKILDDPAEPGWRKLARAIFRQAIYDLASPNGHADDAAAWLLSDAGLLTISATFPILGEDPELLATVIVDRLKGVPRRSAPPAEPTNGRAGR